MVPFGHVLAFAAVVSVLIAIPGPSVLFTISRALTVGRRGALLTVVGNELGLCVQLVAVAFGVGAVVERWAQILTVVKFAGAAYLVFLGVQAIRHRTSMAEALAARLQPVPPLRAIRDGFVVGAANPKTIVFFVVGLPEFVSSAPGHLPVPAQMLAATKAVDGGAGVVHIVKNYTGDVLNFKLAAEDAADEGIKVTSVVIDDDVAVQVVDATERIFPRGLARGLGAALSEAARGISRELGAPRWPHAAEG